MIPAKQIFKLLDKLKDMMKRRIAEAHLVEEIEKFEDKYKKRKGGIIYLPFIFLFGYNSDKEKTKWLILNKFIFLYLPLDLGLNSAIFTAK